MARQLKLYYNFMSQPATSVYLFLKVAQLPFVGKSVAINKGEQFQEEYLKINPMHKVPVLDDNGFILTESAAILKYLAMHDSVNDHWYPRLLKEQARVDEFINWHSADMRYASVKVFLELVFTPKRTKLPINWNNVETARTNMAKCVKVLDQYFLKSNKYLCGNNISIADVVGICDLMVLYLAGEDQLYKSNSSVNAWTERVIERLQPHFGEAHSLVYSQRERMLKFIAASKM